jgi:hypothetical protein|tara:strand:+ start:2129 stop:2260 length:132 start_codon:yes stop_codon:yes gene_type:complete
MNFNGKGNALWSGDRVFKSGDWILDKSLNPKTLRNLCPTKKAN